MNNFWHDVLNIAMPFAILLTIVVTVVIAILVRFILIKVNNRIIRNIVDGVDKKTRKAERTGKPVAMSPRAKRRARTMGSVLNNSVTWVIVIVTLIIVLQEIGVSVVAIAASAGVATAVIGFGAQNVIKDILNGLFLVFEDQYGVGDQVDLGHVSGVVERITLKSVRIAFANGLFEARSVGDSAKALPVIRIVAPEGNYDYQNKYFTDDTQYLVPCGLPAGEEAAIQALVLKAYQVLGCRGWGRVDVMIDAVTRQPSLLEINTSPGMTGHSLVPMSARAEGMSYEALCLHLLQHASLDHREPQA